MAAGMKAWIGTTVAGMLIVVAWTLPPGAPPAQEPGFTPAERIRLVSIDRETNLTGEVLQRITWSDSLSELVLKSAEDGVSVVSAPVVGPRGAAAEQRRRLASMARDEIRSVGAESSDMIFGYVVQPFDHRQHPALQVSKQDRTETYVGSRDGSDYCLQVRVTAREATSRVIARKLTGTDRRRASPRSGLLGPCRFYLRYGLPGPRIEAWLENGGIQFATEKADGVVAPVDGPGPVGRRSWLGVNMMSYSRHPLEIDQCLAGTASACRPLFENPAASDPILQRKVAIVRASPAASVGAGLPFRLVVEGEDFLLADLEDEFGSEAFARFWISDDDVGPAFERAFGVDHGTWMLSWVDRAVGVEPPGPGLPRSAETGTMLSLGLLLGIAFMRNRRRALR